MKHALGRRRWTVDDYHRMAEIGLLGEDDRVELLDGEVVEMSPIGSVHAGLVERVADLLRLRCAGKAQVRTQNPIRIGKHSEPEPDIALVKPRDDYYIGAHPGPDDVLLLIEISDSSVAIDRADKAPLYAAAGVPEVWLVDLRAGEVEVHRGRADGWRARPGEAIAPLALPDLRIAVDELLP